MTEFTYRFQLRSATFPMLSRDYGRLVVNERYDFHNSGLPAHQGTQTQVNPGTPQVAYMENMIPTAEGFRSVCYRPYELPCIIKVGVCECIAPFHYRENQRVITHDRYVSIANIHGSNYIWQKNTGKMYKTHDQWDWLEANITLGENGAPCYELDHGHGEAAASIEIPCVIDTNCDMKEQELGCLRWECIEGITAFNNRMIAWNKDTVFWSSIEPGKELDFCMGLAGMAGSAQPVDIRGPIVDIIPLGEGAVIYTTENAVYMEDNFSSIHQPYDWSPIKCAGGISERKHVAHHEHAGKHIIWGTNGLQEIVIGREAELIHAPVTEFLIGNVLEDYWPDRECGQESPDFSGNHVSPCTDSDETYSAVTESYTPVDGLFPSPVSSYDDGCCPTVSAPSCPVKPVVCPQIQERVCEMGIKVNINYIGCQILAISYGCMESECYEYVLIYDERLKRWGKLKILHKDVFELPHEKSLDAVGILDCNCSVLQLIHQHVKSVVCHDREVDQCNGVIIFGRIQFNRNNISTIQELAIEANPPDYNYNFTWHNSFTGYSWSECHSPPAVIDEVAHQVYKLRHSGRSHYFKLEGTLKLTNILATMTMHGTR